MQYDIATIRKNSVRVLGKFSDADSKNTILNTRILESGLKKWPVDNTIYRNYTKRVININVTNFAALFREISILFLFVYALHYCRFLYISQ